MMDEVQPGRLLPGGLRTKRELTAYVASLPSLSDGELDHDRSMLIAFCRVGKHTAHDLTASVKVRAEIADRAARTAAAAEVVGPTPEGVMETHSQTRAYTRMLLVAAAHRRGDLTADAAMARMHSVIDEVEAEFSARALAVGISRGRA